MSRKDCAVDREHDAVKGTVVKAVGTAPESSRRSRRAEVSGSADGMDDERDQAGSFFLMRKLCTKPMSWPERMTVSSE